MKKIFWIGFILISMSGNVFGVSDQAQEGNNEDYYVGKAPSAKGISCALEIQKFKQEYPPVSYVGDPSSAHYPDYDLVDQKIARARLLWNISSSYHPDLYNYVCIEEIRRTCWEYCGAGIGHGTLELFCIANSCVYY